jgi:hypothetical protein
MPYKELEKKKENARQYYSIHKEKMNQRNTLGHIKGNIQLVCMFVNVGKNNKSDIEVHSIIREIEYNVLKKLKAHGYIITKKED